MFHVRLRRPLKISMHASGEKGCENERKVGRDKLGHLQARQNLPLGFSYVQAWLASNNNSKFSRHFLHNFRGLRSLPCRHPIEWYSGLRCLFSFNISMRNGEEKTNLTIVRWHRNNNEPIRTHLTHELNQS